MFAPEHLPVPPAELAQQGVPRWPQAVHFPALQVVLGAVHAPLAGLDPQQGRPGPPQLPQLPAEQTPSPRPTQVAPALMQIPATQHPPPSQLLPSQHTVPG